MKIPNTQMRVVYIVEPEDMLIPEEVILKSLNGDDTYTPNFTIPSLEPVVQDVSQKFKSTVTSSVAAVTSAAALSRFVAFPMTALPTSLVIAAAVASPLVAQYFSKDQKELSVDQQKAEVKEIEAFLRKHAITLNIANQLGYKFPPGHPQVGQSYKLHPLSHLAESKKEKVYIPHDIYDELLLEEREAELLKLLVELGATKISISQKQVNQGSVEVTGGVIANSKVLGKTEASASNKYCDNRESTDTREFELIGKIWNKGDILDRSKFAWASFEPSWEALIAAREVGNCLKAAIEIKEYTSFSSDRVILAAVKSKLYNGSGSFKANRDLQDGKIYLVKAEFSPINN